MVNIASRADARSYADINMTPLIDVMLVLLIIFIITIPTQTHAVKIDNPAGTPPTSLRAPVVDLFIDFDGSVAWNRTPVDHATLLGYMQAAAREAVPPEVHVRVDRSSRYEIVAQTLAELQQRGLKKIGFVNDGIRFYVVLTRPRKDRGSGPPVGPAPRLEIFSRAAIEDF